jgi:predicted ATP-grasp superfamily ATP-dependent carboligase
MNSRINVLIPDGDSTWALSVVQCLSQVEGYRLFVLSNKKRTATKFSKHTSYYKFYERPDDAQWLDIINSEIEAHQISVIIPIAEKEFAFFIDYKDQLSPISKLIAVPSRDHFNIAINKYKLSDFANTHGIPHPKSFFINSETDKFQVLSQIRFPILIKPLNLKGGDGIKKIDTEAQFPTSIKDPLFIQEYVSGYDIDCSVLCVDGQVITHTIQKGNLEGDNTYAPQLGFDFVENEAVLKVTKALMSKLHWSGIAHVDLRYDDVTKDYKVIEINARFWGSVDASNMAGINFPDVSIQLALNQPIEHKGYTLMSYMRLKGVLKSIKRRPFFIFKRKYLMNHTETRAFLSDPLPTFYKFREWLGRQF